MSRLEAQDFADAQVTPRRQLHRDPPFGRHNCDECVNLGDRHHRPLRRSLLSRSLRHAGIADDELIGDSRRQNPL
jgi:hypothetical protein